MIIPHSRPWINAEDRESVSNSMKTHHIASGSLTLKLENKIKKFTKSSFAIAQSSGTAALILALNTLEVGKDHEVVIPSYVCRNVLDAVHFVGANPIIADVNENGVITKESISHLITARTGAIVAVNIFGHPCDFKKIKELKIPIIEDACQSFGLKINGKMSGSLGDINVLSFHATKCISTGEGGMLLTNNEDLAKKAKVLSNSTGASPVRLFNSISNMQAALGLSQIDRFTQFINRRKEIEQIYNNIIKSLDLKKGVDKNSNLPFRYTLRISQPIDKVMSIFKENNVIIRRGVDHLLHRALKLRDKNFPNSIKIFNTNISIPFYPGLSEKEVENLTNLLHKLRDHVKY